MAKQALGKLKFWGKSAPIQLPIRIFEPLSMLETTMDWFGLSPYFLFKGVMEESYLEKTKYVITMIISGIH
jgi:hypothetical protein